MLQELTEKSVGEGTVKVLVAEDHPLYREGLVESIDARDELQLVGEAENGTQALAGIRELAPDVALVDLRLPELDGLGVIKALAGTPSTTRTVLLSAHVDGELILDAFEAGAAGYLSKEAVGEEICSAILAACDGERVLSPGLERHLAEEIGRRGDGSLTLSFRETEILELMAEGLHNAQIGERLCISESSVKTYLRRAYDKLSVTSRSAAIAEAMRRGILH